MFGQRVVPPCLLRLPLLLLLHQELLLLLPPMDKICDTICKTSLSEDSPLHWAGIRAHLMDIEPCLSLVDLFWKPPAVCTDDSTLARDIASCLPSILKGELSRLTSRTAGL